LLPDEATITSKGSKGVKLMISDRDAGVTLGKFELDYFN